MSLKADVAQWIEHLPSKQKVVGSSPTVGIHANIAQSVEQRSCTAKVIGSIPIIGS